MTDAKKIPADSLSGSVERLAVVFGDQLNESSPALVGLDVRRDAVLMMEVAEESTHVPSHKQRTALFLSAMRHFAESLRRKKMRVRYVTLDDPRNTHSLDGELKRAFGELGPRLVRVVRPGEHRVCSAVSKWSASLKVDVELLEDTHFLTHLDDVQSWLAGRKSPLMDHFYRKQRRRLGVLVTSRGKPVGGSWSLDAANRKAFRSAPDPPPPPRFRIDAITAEVVDLVRRSFPSAPGRLDAFTWPVSRRQATRSLRDFVERRLPDFGSFQDAMWTAQPFLYHSLLSPALNLKLLQPGEVVAAAVAAYESGAAPLNSVEGFVRQIIGWREFVRGVYWAEGEDYGSRNVLGQHGQLPPFYWTAETDMACLHGALDQVLRFGYGHHIQRLMVTGNFALTAGVDPKRIADWYLGMYVDGVDWVTLPNALGMVMHADGGVVGTKPYAATGRYIDRMSNYCGGCRYDPAMRTGPRACPFTTFYWDFLLRHKTRFGRNPRMSMALRNADRLGAAERRAVRKQADGLRRELGVEP